MIEGPIQTNNSGLVFYFDTKEPKSYVGEPTTNLEANPIDFSLWTSGATTTVTANAGYAPNGTLKATRVVTTGFWGSIISSPSNSTTYTWSIYLRSNTGANQTIQCFFEDNGNYGATFVAVNFTVTPQWERFFITATSATSTSIPRFSIRNGDLLAWGIQLEQKSRMSAFTTTSRSNTQGLLDLSGASTIDLTNAGYNASSEITFNGSSNYITTPTINLGNTFTVSAWFNSSGVAGDTVIVGTDANGCDNWLGVSGGYLYGFVTQIADVNNFTFSGATALSNNQWYHGTIVANGNTVTLYLNGKQDYTTTTAFTIGAWNGVFSIGRRCPAVAQRFFNGKIDTVSMYNRALSASEILRNFNSQRSRYSV